MWKLWICSNMPGHTTKIASMSTFVKAFRTVFFENKNPITLKLGIQHWVLQYYHSLSNDDPGLILSSFMTGSSLFSNASAWLKDYTAVSADHRRKKRGRGRGVSPLPPPPNNFGGGQHTFCPLLIIHPHYPSMSMWKSKTWTRSHMYQFNIYTFYFIWRYF